MIEEPPLLTIRRRDRRPTDAQVTAFRGVPTGFVVDAMNGRGTLWSSISPLGDEPNAACSVAGPALTAENRPGDVMGTAAALKFFKLGDVLMIATNGHQGCACAGDRILGMLANSGGVGLVADGPLRDHAGMARIDVPVWCTGLTPGSPVTSGPGRVGVPIQIGGQRVADGDMIVADRDGVVVVPFEEIDAVLARLPAIRAMEERLDAEVIQGRRTSDAIEALLASDRTVWID